MVLWRSGPAGSRRAGGCRSEEEEEDRFSFSSWSSSWVEEEEVGGSWLSLALELAVVPRYPRRGGAPCWAADTRVLEVTSDWLQRRSVTN